MNPYQNLPEGVEGRSFRAFRADNGGRQIEGHAATFDEPYSVGEFMEKIAPGAFDDALGDDVRALVNHDPNQLLGRTKSGTLQLSTDARGLKAKIDLPDTSLGRDIRELVRRGDLGEMSFGFEVAEDSWEQLGDGTELRTIEKVRRLWDVSPVTFPANPNTDVAVRSRRRWVQRGRPSSRRVPFTPDQERRLEEAIAYAQEPGSSRRRRDEIRYGRTLQSHATRVHEAAHAVVGYVLGDECRRIDAVSSRDGVGLYSGSNDLSILGPVSVAGVVGESLFADRPYADMSKADRRFAERAARAELGRPRGALHDQRQDIAERLSVYRRKARAVLQANDQIVRDLADQLRKTPRMSGRDVARFFEGRKIDRTAHAPAPSGSSRGGYSRAARSLYA